MGRYGGAPLSVHPNKGRFHHADQGQADADDDQYVNWTGLYIGAQGGAGYDRDRIGFVGSTEGTSTRFAGLLDDNYQLANKFVLGFEGDVSWGDLKGGSTCGNANGLSPISANGLSAGLPGSFSPFFLSCNTHMDWMATATAKLGYAWGRTLYYVKGGAAFTDETVSTNCIVGPLNVAGNSVSATISRVC